jgi:hypothetical protein
MSSGAQQIVETEDRPSPNLTAVGGAVLGGFNTFGRDGRMAAMPVKLFSALLLACLLLGCGPKTQTYDVAVRNNTQAPLTVWLTKRGDAPLETQWLSPEQLAIHGHAKDAEIPGIVVQPGQARGAQIKGKFNGNASAMLRIYRGQLTLDELLATHEVDAMSRLDVPLTPGVNHFIVADKAGKLSAERSAQFERATAGTTKPTK